MSSSKSQDRLRLGIERAQQFNKRPKRSLRLPKRSGDPYSLMISFLALSISFAGFLTSNAYRRASIGLLYEAGDVHVSENENEFEQYIRLIFVNNGSVPIIMRGISGALYNGTAESMGHNTASLVDRGELKDRSFVLKPGESWDATRKFTAKFDGFLSWGPKTEFHSLREYNDEWRIVRLYPDLYVRIIIPDVGEIGTEINEGPYALSEWFGSDTDLDRKQDINLKKSRIGKDALTNKNDSTWKYINLYDNYAFFNRVREVFSRLAGLL